MQEEMYLQLKNTKGTRVMIRSFLVTVGTIDKLNLTDDKRCFVSSSLYLINFVGIAQNGYGTSMDTQY